MRERCNSTANALGLRISCTNLRYIHARLVGNHYSDVIMGAMTSQITSLTIVYSTVYSGEDLRKYQSSASLAFVRGSHRSLGNFPHKGPVTRKMFVDVDVDDVIMNYFIRNLYVYSVHPVILYIKQTHFLKLFLCRYKKNEHHLIPFMVNICFKGKLLIFFYFWNIFTMITYLSLHIYLPLHNQLGNFLGNIKLLYGHYLVVQ